MRMEIEKKVGGPRIRQQTLGPFHVADTVVQNAMEITRRVEITLHVHFFGRVSVFGHPWTRFLTIHSFVMLSNSF